MFECVAVTNSVPAGSWLKLNENSTRTHGTVCIIMLSYIQSRTLVIRPKIVV